VILARNVVYRVNQAQFADERLTGLMARLPDIPGVRTAEISGEAFIRGAGAAYSASVKPELDAILRACGLAATGTFTVGAEKWEYKPQSGATIGESVTAALFTEVGTGAGPQGKIIGAFGTARLQGRAGEPAVLAFRLLGLYVAPGDVALVTGSVPTVQPPVFKSGAVTFGGVSHRAASLELDFGNDLQQLDSANDAQAVAAVLIAGRRPTITTDPELVATATYNAHGKRDAGTLDAASYQFGTAQYNRLKASAPKFQITDITDGQRNGVRIWNLAALLSASAGGDEYTLLYD